MVQNIRKSSAGVSVYKNGKHMLRVEHLISDSLFACCKIFQHITEMQEYWAEGIHSAWINNKGEYSSPVFLIFQRSRFYIKTVEATKL